MMGVKEKEVMDCIMDESVLIYHTEGDVIMATYS